MTYEEAKEISKRLEEIDECDKILAYFETCKLSLRHKNGGIAYTFDDNIKQAVEETFIAKKVNLMHELDKM